MMAGLCALCEHADHIGLCGAAVHDGKGNHYGCKCESSSVPHPADTTRRRFIVVVEYDTIGDEEPYDPQDVAADALHGGLDNYYGVEVVASPGVRFTHCATHNGDCYGDGLAYEECVPDAAEWEAT